MPRWLRRSFLQLNIGNGSDRESRSSPRAHGVRSGAWNSVRTDSDAAAKIPEIINKSAPIAAQESYARNDEGRRPALSQTLSDPLLNFTNREVVPSI